VGEGERAVKIEAEAHFRGLLESAPDAIVITNGAGQIVLVNSLVEKMFGYSRDELLHQPVEALMPERFRADHAQHCSRYLSEPRTRLMGMGLSLWGQRKDGGEFPVEISLSPMDTEEGLVIISIIRDVTDRQQAEEALRQAYDELEARVRERTAELAHANEARLQVLRRLVTAQEEERRRVSRELHDQMGQHLTGLMLGLKALENDCQSLPHASERLQKLQDLTDSIMQEIHHLAWELRPAALDDLGLSTVLRRYTEEWSQRSGVAVDFHSSGLDEQRAPSHVETTLYRVVQEALTNVLKHAQADRVSVLLERRRNHVLAIIEDDGKGFDAEAMMSASDAEQTLGLLGMKERVSLVGGTLDVESTPGAGTTVFVKIPVSGEWSSSPLWAFYRTVGLHPTPTRG
jgi:PAS domain S-box-containing protein